MGQLRGIFGACLLAAVGLSTALGQSNEGSYTLKANSRIVVTDVTVTDGKGKPVTGLDQSAFRIFDEDKPQAITSFEEHTASSATANKQVWNVIVLDTATMEVVDQMYLYQELQKFAKALPADEPVAIYVHANDFALLVQNFTTDRDLVLKGLHRGIPRVQYASASDVNEGRALDQLAQDLRTLPGRKNVLWFGSGSSLFETKDPNYLPDGIDLKPVYDELETARIALYPIDPRVTSMDLNNQTETAQRSQMIEEATATGGRAYYGLNHLGQIASEVLENGRCFYTLTYTPEDGKHENKWHHVKVQVGTGQYHVSYRTGYFDQAPGAATGDKHGRTIPRVIADVGSKIPQAEPIPFAAKLVAVEAGQDLSVPGATTKAVAAMPKKNEQAYKIRYVVPMSAFTSEDAGEKRKVRIGVAILTYSEAGTPVGKVMNEVALSYAAGDEKPGATLGFEERVNLPKGEGHLYLAVWDLKTNRLGTLQIPVVTPKH